MANDAGLVQDLTAIDNLSNDVILDVVKRRFQRQQIYTYVGDILLAVNPCTEVDIYDNEFHRKYRDLGYRSNAEPHVYWIAETAHRNLRHTGEKQCIVVSGESGAGKTESTKYVLKHLITRSDCAVQNLVEKLDKINPLVELFGNAVTTLNGNSSRFGKLIELFYTSDGKLLGGKLETFVLEKSRVVSHGQSEKNFHVFYALFAGLDESDLLQHYLLENPSSYRIIQPSEDFRPSLKRNESSGFHDDTAFSDADDRHKYRRQYQMGESIMRDLGYSNQDIHAIREILAAILHLGNIEFCEEETSEDLDIEEDIHFLNAIQMLHLDEDVVSEFRTSLLTSAISARGETLHRRKSLQQAEEERDALAKDLYNVLFTAIVSKISDNLKPSGRTECSIGLLDISGFENFQDNSKNRFEQLLINITNERLHQYFQKQIFKAEEEDFIREGLQYDKYRFLFTGNNEVLSLIFDSPGVLSILEEEMVVPKASDTGLVKKFDKFLTQSPQYVKQDGQLTFGIHHFAGKVLYNANGFLEKNKGKLSSALLGCVRKSPNSILCHNIDKARSTRSRNVVSGRPSKIHNSAVKQYKKSLNSLNDVLAKSRPLFIRCIKPNHRLEEGVFDCPYARSQLLSGGILEVSRVRRDGFPYRYKFEHFVNRYKTYMREFSMPLTTSVANCRDIVALTNLKMDEDVVFGKSKIFLKNEGLNTIDAALNSKLRDLQRQREVEQKALEQKRLEQKRMELKKLEERRKRRGSVRSNGSQRSTSGRVPATKATNEGTAEGGSIDKGTGVTEVPLSLGRESLEKGGLASESSYSSPPPYESVIGEEKQPLFDIFRTTERDEAGCDFSERVFLRLSRLGLYFLLLGVVLASGCGLLLGLLGLCSELKTPDEGIYKKIKTELLMVFCLPLGIQWCFSLGRTCFGNKGKFRLSIFLLLFIMENAHVCGTAMLIFKVLPRVNSVWGMILLTASALVPSAMNVQRQLVLSSKLHRKLFQRMASITSAILAFGAQSFVYFVICFNDFLNEEKSFILSTWEDFFYFTGSIFFVSWQWIECFVSSDLCCLPLLKWRRLIQRTRDKLDIPLILSKCAIFFVLTGLLSNSFSFSIFLPDRRNFHFIRSEWLQTIPLYNRDDSFTTCVHQSFLEDDSFAISSIQAVQNVTVPFLNFTTTDSLTTSSAISEYKTLVINSSSSVQCEFLVTERGSNITTVEQKSFNLFQYTCSVENETLLKDILQSAEDSGVLHRYCRYTFGSVGDNYLILILLCILPITLAYASCVACRLHMQRTSFSFGLVLAPIAAHLLIRLACSNGMSYFEGSFTCTNSQFNITEEYSAFIISVCTCISILLMSWHVWWPSTEVMAKADRMFVMPILDGLFVPISLLFRRRFDHFEKHLEKRIKHNTRRKDHSKAKERPLVYICATMWHETKQEMTQLLQSLFRMDYFHSQCQLAEKKFNVKVDFFNVEIHVIFDDAFTTVENTNKRVPNQWVQQLVECIDGAATSVAKGNIVWDKIPTRTTTPYGGRLSWVMPGGTHMIFHLKDKEKIRTRKRWSQVMYMYYLLGYKFTEKRTEQELNEHARKRRRFGKSSLLNHFDHKSFEKASNTFILTLDGDTDFKPEAVKLLLDKMIKNNKVGAVCGRIHPMGAGPMIWYQRFEYSVGHWLQKAAEHVFGCVLCCPGCFSLFRGSALMDDNVMKTYTTPPIEAKHYIQFEQGEDRWLCTLLLQQGWKIEYCAGADAYTFSPETFKDFFVQRRRWAPSTLANIIDLVSSWSTTVRTNDNISSLFMFYQFILLSSSLLGPALVTLMIAGSYTAVFLVSEWNGFFMAIIPVLIYIIICLKAKNEVQIMVAGLLSSFYSVVMVIVTVGTLINSLSEPIYSPNVILPMSLGFVFLTAGLLHPKEIVNLMFGILYYLTVPSTFVFLTVYYLCNLHNVTWGTREVSRPLTQTNDAKKQSSTTKEMSNGGLLSKIIKKLGLSKLGKDIKLLLSRTMGSDKSDSDAKESTIQIKLERAGDTPMLPVRVLPVDSTNDANSLPIPTPLGPEQNDTDPWTDSDYLGDKPIKEPEAEECTFWEYTIKKYLHPAHHDEAQKKVIKEELVSLRNNVVFGFFLLNLLFTILVFQLQLKRESLRDFFLLGEYEPVSLAFLSVFAVILFTQYVGMIIHRWGTYQHLIASTNLGICGKHASDESYAQLALKEAGKLQSANSDIVPSIDGDAADVSMSLDYECPPEDYDDEDTPDYDTHSPDYSDDEEIDTRAQNAYERNFRQRFYTRRQVFFLDDARHPKRPPLYSARHNTHQLYNRTWRENNRRNFEPYKQLEPYWNHTNNYAQNVRQVHHV